MIEQMMTVDYFQKNWEPQVGSRKTELTVWDMASQGYKNREIPSFEKDRSLQVTLKNKMWNQDSNILDVGCGAGIYSVAFSRVCKNVTGVDFSQGMIRAARENAERYGRNNLEFHCLDWHSFELAQKNWENSFDLVFANMTPAVQSYHTLELLNHASNNWCFISKPVEWKHSTTYDLLQHLGLWKEYRTFDTDMLCAFDVLRLQGKKPMVEYDNAIWADDHTLEEACPFFIRRIEMKKILTDEQKLQAQKYLASKAVNGMIRDRTEVTIAMMYWQV